jgi:hypothetical protein
LLWRLSSSYADVFGLKGMIGFLIMRIHKLLNAQQDSKENLIWLSIDQRIVESKI